MSKRIDIKLTNKEIEDVSINVKITKGCTKIKNLKSYEQQKCIHSSSIIGNIENNF